MDDAADVERLINVTTDASKLSDDAIEGLLKMSDDELKAMFESTSKLLDELVENGIKPNPAEILQIGRNSSSEIVFLEKGNSKAGYEHILNHLSDFVKNGVSENEIINYVFKAVTEGKTIGYQGKGTGRPIFELIFNGEVKRVAVTIGDNGFIVGANPVSIKLK